MGCLQTKTRIYRIEGIYEEIEKLSLMRQKLKDLEWLIFLGIGISEINTEISLTGKT